MTRSLVLVLLPLLACSKTEPASSKPAAGSAMAAKAKPSAFSASLSATLAKEGVTAPGKKAGSAAVAGSAAGSAAVAVAATGSGTGSAAGPGSGAAKMAGSAAPIMDLDHRERVKVSPALAAIKLDLDPDWDRDLGEGATISFVLRVPNTDKKKLFLFHYGYEDPSAPGDPDAYIKWLSDHKIMTVTLNRQNGAALLVEGKDPTGDEVFRAMVTYGGKRLVCYGSRYRTPAYNPLGDLRDKVVFAAEKICETLAL